MFLERAGYILPRTRLRRAAPPPRPEPSDGPPSPPIPLEQRDPLLRAAEVQVAVIIAMPNPHRSAYVSPTTHTHGPGTGLHLGDLGKGKARSSETWDDVEEEGVPDVVFGSAKVPLLSQDGDCNEST
ncbi:hypothetical protein BD414DRAFT_494077 [Trametes punicea]|nr:hypothetical protein BD414DRAFT_494077 [Trametes punicea]